MTRDEIMDILKTVNYPGFSRDIVSFGMVSEVAVTGDSIQVTLEAATTNDDQKAKLSQAVKSALIEQLKAGEVEVTINAPKPSGREQAKQGPGQQASSIPGVKFTIAVASGKGGVGKSTVAVNMAAALSLTGASVGILDLDIYGPSLPLIMGVSDRPKLNEKQQIIPLLRYGMRVMSFGLISGNQAPTIWRGPMVAKMTQQFFTDVDWGELDYLVLDLPPGTGDIQLTLVQQVALSGAVIVTTPQQLALLDVRKGADMFATVNTRVLGVIENMSGLPLRGVVRDAAGELVPGAIIEMSGLGEIDQLVADDQGVFQADVPIFRSGGGQEESERLQVPLLGRIPLSPELVIASDSGEPYVFGYPDTPVTHEFKQIAAAVMEGLWETAADHRIPAVAE
ncbi:MAG: Mrp/NBP35 family ATP-binding protein [Candidatus Marinimicrobia bacterium]|nr:Mrp/NBP35 family ATP-binding protein [Candidatus Neomarinimicrobiota bacterium]